MLTALAGTTTLLFVAAGFCVGLRLLWMARQTRGLPEISLGLGLFLIVGVGMLLQLAGLALAASGSAAAPTLLAGSTVAMNAGWAAVWVFTWRVFRPGSTVARAVVGAALLSLLVLAALAVRAGLAGTAGGPTSAMGRTLATLVVAQLLYVWTASESLVYWRRMRRRVALALADPVVANRFLLWGVVALLSFVSLLSPFVLTVAGQDYRESAAGRLLTAVSGLGCALTLWLAFMPPEAYLRRLRAGAPTRAT